MPVPPKRRSRSKARRGRAHQALKNVSLSKCLKCGKSVKPHRACSFCGVYKGKQIIKIKSKIKKEKK